MEGKLYNGSIHKEQDLNVSGLINCSMTTFSNCTDDDDDGVEHSLAYNVGITFAIFIIAVVVVGLFHCKIRGYGLLGRHFRSRENEHQTLHHVSSEGEFYCPPPSYSSGIKMMRLDSTTIQGYPPPKYSSLVTTIGHLMGSNNPPQEVSGSIFNHTPDRTPVASSSVGSTSNAEIGGDFSTYCDHMNVELNLRDCIVLQCDHSVRMNEETHECQTCPRETAISDEFPRHYLETGRSQNNSGYMNQIHPRPGSGHVYHITLDHQLPFIFEHLPTYAEANAPVESTRL